MFNDGLFTKELTVAKEIKHVSFNPSIFGLGYPSTLSGICSNVEQDGWSLMRVVYHSNYEAVAVFERD